MHRIPRLFVLLNVAFASELLHVAFASSLAFAQGVSPSAGYVVIVHPSNPTTKVDRDFLADVFLKRKTRWRNDETIVPVDLPTDSRVRRRFVEVVLGRSMAAVRSHWQQVIFSGRGLPPVELDGDLEVIHYVRVHRGAVGYVSSAAPMEGVKVLAVE